MFRHSFMLLILYKICVGNASHSLRTQQQDGVSKPDVIFKMDGVTYSKARNRLDYSMVVPEFQNHDPSFAHVLIENNEGSVLDINWDPEPPRRGDSQKDLVQPNETHLEGVPYFIQHPKPLYYTLKGHPATIECIAEPVSHAVIECAEQVIPYKGPEEPGRLKVTKLDESDRPHPNGKRWKIELQVRAKEVEEWFDSYVCRCEVWNKVEELQRPKKVVSRETAVVEAYMDRKFQLEPVSTELKEGERLVLTCIPPKGKPDPEVYWLKDGKRVGKDSFPHILLNDYNHLIIENTTFADGGNYTCVAECLGVEYRYATSTVAVHSVFNPPSTTTVSPPAPQWGAWSSCSWNWQQVSSAGRLCQQKRYQICTQHELVFGTDQLVAHQRPSVSELHKCPRVNFQIRNCSLDQCNDSSVKNVSFPIEVILHSEREMSHSHEIIIYTCVFLLLLVVIFVILFVTFRTRWSQGIPSSLFCFESCLQGKKSYVTELRGLSGKEPLFKQNLLAKSQTSFEGRPLIYDYVPQMDSGTLMSNEPNYSIAQYDNPQFILPAYSTSSAQAIFVSPNAPSRTPSFQLPSRHLTVFPSVTFENKMFANDHVSQPVTISSVIYGSQILEEIRLASTTASNVNSGEQSSGQTVTTTGPESRTTGSSNGSLGVGCSLPTTHTTTFDSMTRENVSYEELRTSNPYQYVTLIDESEEETFELISNGITDFLQLPQKGVTLRVLFNEMDGAQPQLIRLSFSQDRFKPGLNVRQTILSPVVGIAQMNAQTIPLVLLTIPHCAILTTGSWMLSLMRATDYVTEHEHHVQQPISFTNYDLIVNRSTVGEWKNIATFNREAIQIDRDCCDIECGCMANVQENVMLILTDVPGYYCIVGESSYPNSSMENKITIPACKSLTLAAYGNRTIPTSMDYAVRIYVLMSTPDALDYVSKLEGALDGQLVGELLHVPFANDGSSLCFMVTSISTGWRSKLQSGSQEIPFRHIWNGTQISTLHCAFNFECIDKNPNGLLCEFQIYQASDMQRCRTMHISTDGEKDTHEINFNLGAKSIFRLPKEKKRNIIRSLEQSCDWQDLANKIGLQRFVPQISCTRCPAAALLELWESTCTDQSSFNTLETVLENMNLTS